MNNGNSIVNTAVQFLGTPYVWGGSSTDGFDCSGLTQYVYSKNNISLPRTVQEQYNTGIPIDVNNLQAGDLVFFNGYKGSGGVGHVGIYVGNGQYLHAPKSGDVVKVSNLSGRNDYVGARRYTNGATNLGILDWIVGGGFASGGKAYDVDDDSSILDGAIGGGFASGGNAYDVDNDSSLLDKLLTYIVRILAILFLIVLAIVFFMKAFDIKL